MGWLLLRLWMVLHVTFCAGAWVLSALGMLNLAGYAILALPWVVWSAREIKAAELKPGETRRFFAKAMRRFRKPLPLTFAVIAVMSLVGGIIWPSLYTDSIAYRVPRILHWIAEERWHWIHTQDQRVNVLGLNMEMLWVPLMLLFKNDRPLFIFNLLSFLLLPGVFYSFLRLMRVRGRVARGWMWVLPGGYIFAMQAGSLGSDGYSAVFSLAMIAFALRARKSGDVWDAWHSIFAAAVLTGVKQISVPLGIVWLPAIWPSLRLLLRRPLGTLAVAVVAISVSFLPISYLNVKHAGNWKGFPEEELAIYVQKSPWWGIAFNSFAVVVQNLAPPINPWALQWNARMKEFTDTTWIGSHFVNELELAHLHRGTAEHNATVGMGVWGVLILMWLMSRHEARRPVEERKDWVITAVKWTPFLAMLVVFAESGVGYNSRYITPYYPLMMAAFLSAPRLGPVTRSRWWLRAAIAANLITIGLLIISRQRPLWPAVTIANTLMKMRPESGFVQKFHISANVTSIREKTFPLINSLIPAGEKVVGYATGKQSFLEIPLWMPMGSRKVSRITQADTAQSVRARGIRYAIVDMTGLMEWHESKLDPESINRWLAKFNAEVVKSFEIYPDPRTGTPWPVYWVRFRD